MKRVTRGPIVVLTFDGDLLDRFWLNDYAPELIEAERKRYPKIAALAEALGGEVTIQLVPVPFDCTDGFTEAFYARPEKFLESSVRQSQSAWTFVSAEAVDRAIDHLRRDLETGVWDEKYGHLRSQPYFLGSLTLVVSDDR